MTLTLFKPAKNDSPRTALATLREVRARAAAKQREDADLQERETNALRTIREYDDACAELQEFRTKHLDACAEREFNPSACDPSGFALRVSEARARIERLQAPRDVAERVLAKIRAARLSIRAEQRELSAGLATAVHSAAVERMVATAPALLAAERHYLDALAATFGAASLCDRVARELVAAGMPHPGFCDGVLAVNRLFLPRPTGPAFHPVPKHDDIARTINDAARALEKELLG